MKAVLRIAYHRYFDDKIFEEHLKLVRDNADIIDEINLFVEFSHYGYWPVEQQAEHCKLLRKRIAQYREVGIPSVGLNVLCTVGHLDENWDILPATEMQHYVSEESVESRSCLCPSGEDYLEYIAARYRLYAGTGADFIWFDDDMRMGNHNRKDSCYCPRCVALFSRRRKTEYTRESLVEALKTDAALRADWRKFHESLYLRVMRTAEQAVHSVAPGVKMGLMTGNGNGSADPGWFRAGKSVMGRPGGGFYNERVPADAIGKALETDAQVSRYPAGVRDIQYEFECFNYQRLAKSLRMKDLESVLSLANGCSGVLYNDFCFDDRPELVDLIRARKPQWNALTRRAGKYNTGVYCPEISMGRQLVEIGIPVTADVRGAVCACITRYGWEMLGTAEARRILTAMGVLTDGAGLEWLHQAGLGALCGGSVAKVYDNGQAERFTDHPINGAFGGYHRDVWMNFFGAGRAYELAPEEGAEVISRLETVTYLPGGVSLYLMQREDGLCFAADGYLFPDSLEDDHKRAQLIRLLDHLSGGRLPVVTEQPLKLAPFVRSAPDGGVTVLLVNAMLDDTGEFDTVIRTTGDAPRMISEKGRPVKLPAEKVDGGYRVHLNSVEPWRYIVLTNRKK